MLIDKNYKNMKRIDNGNYYIEGDLEVNEDLEINLDGWLEVQGSIKVKGKIFSKETIKAGCGIEAGWGIEAGDGIKAGWGIEAGLSITAKWISSELRIFAGLAIWKKTKKEDMQINVEELKEGEICFGELNIVKVIKKITKEEAERELSEKYECEVKIN